MTKKISAAMKITVDEKGKIDLVTNLDRLQARALVKRVLQAMDEDSRAVSVVSEKEANRITRRLGGARYVGPIPKDWA